MADELVKLDRRITEALNALRCARAVVEHSANSTTRWHEDMAERTLNELLDQRHHARMSEHSRCWPARLSGLDSTGSGQRVSG